VNSHLKSKTHNIALSDVASLNVTNVTSWHPSHCTLRGGSNHCLVRQHHKGNTMTMNKSLGLINRIEYNLDGGVPVADTETPYLAGPEAMMPRAPRPNPRERETPHCRACKE
jgi:hypothetical protein